MVFYKYTSGFYKNGIKLLASWLIINFSSSHWTPHKVLITVTTEVTIFSLSGYLWVRFITYKSLQLLHSIFLKNKGWFGLLMMKVTNSFLKYLLYLPLYWQMQTILKSWLQIKSGIASFWFTNKAHATAVQQHIKQFIIELLRWNT
jgi:hypothetical protein